MILSALKRFRAHHAGLFAGAIVAAVVFFIAGIGIRLLMGPVSLAPVSGQLSQALANALPGISVKFDKAGLEWSPESGRVDLVILGARVFDSGGRIIAQAPKAALGLAAGPLLHGQLVVKRITLIGVQLTLVRTKQGGIRLGIAADKDQPDLLKEINDAINASNSGVSALEVLAIRDARLAFLDEATGLFVVAPKASLQVKSAGQNLDTSLDADIEISGRKAHVAGSMLLPPDNAPVNAQLTVTGLDLNALGRNAKTLAALKPLRIVLDASSNLTLAHGRVAKLAFDVAAHGGIAGMGPKHAGLLLGRLQATGRYDSATGRLNLDSAQLHGGPVAGRMRGAAMLSFGGSDDLASIALDATADSVTLAQRNGDGAPVSFARVGIQGNYTLATGEADLTHLTVVSRNLDAQFSGKSIFAANSAPSIEASGRLGAMSVRDLIHYWPVGVAEGARDWIARSISTGTVGPVTLAAHIPAGALDAPALADNMLNLSFPFSGVTAEYIKGLTPITQGKGTGTLTGDTFTAEVESGKIGPLTLSKGRAVIANLHVPGAVGDITAHVDGQMHDILALIDMKPLNYPTRFHISPAATGGSAAVDLSFRVPMLKNVSVNAIGILVKANVANLDLALGKEAHLTNGNLALTVDAKHLQAVGTASYSGKAVTLDWTEDLESTSDITTRIAAKAVMDQATRAAFGLDLGDYVTGPVNVTAALTGHRGLLRHADLAIDLAPATVSMPLLNYRKPPGMAAAANVAANFSGDSAIHDADVKLSGASLSGMGTARFGAHGSINQIDLGQVRIGAANDFALQYSKGSDGSVDLVLKGRSLDGSALAGRGSKSNGGSAKEDKFDGPFRLRVNLDRLALRAGVSLGNFVLDVSGIENRPQTLSLSGALSKTTGISGALTTVNGQRQIVLDTTDASLLFKGVFGFTSIHGGHVHATASFPHPANIAPPPGSVDYQGTITAENFRVLHQPLLTRLFTAGSLEGLLNLMGGQGVAVDTMTVPYVAQNGVLTIRDARATGPSIGISADGYLDRAKNDIGLRGTIAPLYGLNTVLNNIPLLGNVLTSHKGEGIFGIGYSVSGNADEPHISINPLTLLTPGILRRIFQGRIPTEAQSAPQPAPPVSKPPNQ